MNDDERRDAYRRIGKTEDEILAIERDRKFGVGSPLEPCPFCGGSSEMSIGGYSKLEYFGVCRSDSCGVEGPSRKTRYQAAQAWNRRTAPTASR